MWFYVNDIVINNSVLKVITISLLLLFDKTKRCDTVTDAEAITSGNVSERNGFV